MPSPAAPTTSARRLSPTWSACSGATPRRASTASKISGRGLRRPTASEITTAPRWRARPASSRMRTAVCECEKFEQSPIARSEASSASSGAWCAGHPHLLAKQPHVHRREQARAARDRQTPRRSREGGEALLGRDLAVQRHSASRERRDRPRRAHRRRHRTEIASRVRVASCRAGTEGGSGFPAISARGRLSKSRSTSVSKRSKTTARICIRGS